MQYCTGATRLISPLLLNVALHGMEQAAGVRYRNSARSDAETVKGSPVLVRYADDYVALCYSREQAEQVKDRLSAWLAPRGLRFNQDKTKIVHVEDGFTFLGFSVRRYVDRQGSGKLFIKPSKESVKRLRARLAADTRNLRGSNASAVIFHLNPVIRGWSAYHRSVVSGKVFDALDHHVWHLTYGGRATRTRTSRGAGSRPATSAGSTSPDTIGGSLVTGTPAPTSPSSPGPRSFVTSRSTAGRRPTIQP